MEEDFEDLYKTLYTLRTFIGNYKEIKTGEMFCSPEILKNAQDSIKELCTQIINKTSN